MATCGIYTITCTTNGRTYVGSSNNIEHRFSHHRRTLIRQCHVNAKLQAAWNKHGEDAFAFAVLEVTMPEARRDREDYWITYYDAYRQGFNLHEGASPIRVSDETRAKLAEVARNMPAEQRAKISASTRKAMARPEVREKVLQAARRRADDPEWRAWAREAGSSQATLDRLVEARKLQDNPEIRRKMSDAHRGKPLSESHKQAMRDAWARKAALRKRD